MDNIKQETDDELETFHCNSCNIDIPVIQDLFTDGSPDLSRSVYAICPNCGNYIDR